jgi:hypothetical protein
MDCSIGMATILPPAKRADQRQFHPWVSLLREQRATTVPSSAQPHGHRQPVLAAEQRQHHVYHRDGDGGRCGRASLLRNTLRHIVFRAMCPIGYNSPQQCDRRWRSGQPVRLSVRDRLPAS